MLLRRSCCTGRQNAAKSARPAVFMWLFALGGRKGKGGKRSAEGQFKWRNAEISF